MSAWRNQWLLCLAWAGLTAAANAAGPMALKADIGPQPLTEALASFGRQTGLQLIYVSGIAEAQHSKGAPAGLTVSAALTQLLDGTGLTFEFLNARTVRIFPAPTVVPALTASSAAPLQRTAARAPGLQEVLVTGTRGQEPLSRVPIDMVVWTERAMEASHVEGIAQIAALTPGVNFGTSTTIGDEYTDLVIRGVTSRHGATVGVYVDDSPLPPGRGATYLTSFPSTFDLERIEILRGPQTVLFGDHAMSGAVRFIPNQPSLTAPRSLFRAELGVNEYGSMSYEAGAAVGGPLRTDVLGFRVSGWFREDGGYVDRVDPLNTTVTLDRDSNRVLNRVVRGAVTFAPAAGVQITPALMYQSIYIRGYSAFDTTLSDPARGVFKEASLLQEPWEESYYLASVKLTARLPGAELRAVASYFDQTGSLRNTEIVRPANLAEAATQTIFGQEQRASLAEARLTSLDPDAFLTWVTGAVASRQHTRHPYQDPNSGNDATVTEQNQLAGFGQIALKVTQHLTASVGVRIGHWTSDSVTESPSAFHAHGSNTWTAPRFGLSWQADERNLVYLTVAKGYGSGGVYPKDPGVDPLPYPPDTLWSYEIGSKHNLLDGELRLETSVFHVTWNNGPPDPAFFFSERSPVPGRAVSNGFALTAEAAVVDHAKVALDIAYTDAHFIQTITLNGQLFVAKGDAVPVSPWNLTASVERDFPLRANVTASVRIEDAFRSAASISSFEAPACAGQPPGCYFPTSPPDPSTNVLNLRAAVKWSGFELATLLSNALDSRPVLSGRSSAAPLSGAPLAGTLVPRTLSVSGSWRF